MSLKRPHGFQQFFQQFQQETIKIIILYNNFIKIKRYHCLNETTVSPCSFEGRCAPVSTKTHGCGGQVLKRFTY